MREELIETLNQIYDVCEEAEGYYLQSQEHEEQVRNYEYQIQQCNLPTVAKVILGIFIMGCTAMIWRTIFGLGDPSLAGILMFAGAYFGLKKANELYLNTKKDEIRLYEEEIAKEKLEQEECMNQANSCIWMNDQLLSNVPNEYLGTLPIGEMRKYLLHQRANTLPEAINLYEEQLHRWKLEEQNDMILESQYRQEQRLANIEFYSALSASLDAAAMMDRD